MQVAAKRESPLQRHSIAAYFFLTYAVSWVGAFLVAAPHLIHGESVPKTTGLLMFPVMLLGPACVGIFLTGKIDGKIGLQNLRFRMCRFSFPAQWYAVLLIPPALVLAVLFGLKYFVSPIFTPNIFLAGIAFGCVAGFVEEIGWSGYAFPKLRVRFGGVKASILLGLLWGTWHLPVIDYLGTAVPHGPFLFRYFLVFVAAMTAIRILIGWLYVHTGSVLIAQCMHASSTASLVIFSPTSVTSGQETFWYTIYALTLWLTVAIVLVTRGRRSLNPDKAAPARMKIIGKHSSV